MPAGVPEGVEVLSVAAFTAGLKGTLETAYPQVWVAGEITSLSRPASGHMYLTLREGQAATVGCAFFRGFNLRLRFQPRDGMEVVVRGKVTVYEPRGNYQLIIEEMHPTGIGAAELALRQLRERLMAKGYFRPERKRPIPRYPRRVALVTSATGAAVRDLLEVLGRRWPTTEVLIRSVRVQGEPAPGEIAAAVVLLNRLHARGEVHIDTIILGRGGGSSEDLDAFNDERVADALFASRVPTIAAIGHEIDVTLADLVADCRAATPSQAAELAVPDREEMLALLEQSKLRLVDGLRNRVRLARQRLRDLSNRRPLTRPLDRIRELEQRLDDRSQRLERAMRVRLERLGQRLEGVAGKLASLSPLNVLARGYSLTRTGDGRVVRDAADVGPGEVIRTTLERGEVVSRVEWADGGS